MDTTSEKVFTILIHDVSAIDFYTYKHINMPVKFTSSAYPENALALKVNMKNRVLFHEKPTSFTQNAGFQIIGFCRCQLKL